MAGTILTPTLLWKDFTVDNDFNENVVKSANDGEFVLTDITFNGRKIDAKERVQIFATLMTKGNEKANGAILYVQDLGEQPDADLMRNLASQGYLVMSVDVCGKREEGEFTRYPDKISYANYVEVKDNLYAVEKDANRTCWFEWACVLRYALSYLKTQRQIKKVGGFAVGESATALWQVAGMDKELDLAVFALNAGWAGYRDTDKFGGEMEPQFTDDMFKYVAGIEPQAYAMHVQCPVLVLSATNSNEYACDRVYDTLTHINEEVFSAVNYSVGHINSVNRRAIDSAKIFLDNFLLKSKPSKLSSDIDIRCECVDGKIKLIVSGQTDGAKDVCVYLSEETIKPAYRCWRKVTDYKKDTESGELTFEYAPYQQSEVIIAFAQITFKNGFTVGSKLIAKKFGSDEVALSYKSNLIYSSRIEDAESVFTSAEQSGGKASRIDGESTATVEVKKGPMGISGVGCKEGLLTFKVGAKTDRPQNGAMLMFDVYSQNQGANSVKLIADYFGQKIEYYAWFNLLGGETWQNVKIEQKKFKTEQGMPLKSYDKIDAIEFTKGEGEYIINNALWV